jgi:hypothetical protein
VNTNDLKSPNLALVIGHQILRFLAFINSFCVMLQLHRTHDFSLDNNIKSIMKCKLFFFISSCSSMPNNDKKLISFSVVSLGNFLVSVFSTRSATAGTKSRRDRGKIYTISQLHINFLIKEGYLAHILNIITSKNTWNSSFHIISTGF